MNNPLILSLPGLKLIGIHGKSGSGKDTATDYICNSRENTFQEAFAQPLKTAAASAFGISEKNFHSDKETINPYWGVSPRQIGQFMGTEMFRNTICQLIPEVSDNFWVLRMAGRLNNQLFPDWGDELEVAPYEEGDTVIISDVRFQNEYDFITSNGGYIIHLTRDGANGTVGIPDHASESDINLHDKERTFKCENNGTLYELYEKLDSLMFQFSLSL